MKRIFPIASTLLFIMTGCSDVEGDDHDHDHHDHEHEVITTVVLSFSSQADDSEILEFVWADPENDGSPVVDDIVLEDGVAYDVYVEFLNGLEDPAEDITPEIADEAEEHQIFFTGSGVEGPATGSNDDAVVSHAYLDADTEGLPVGLENEIVSLTAGSGELILTLRHMPEESGSPVKVEGAAEDVAEGGFSSIGGANDVSVTFSITVE